MRTTEEFCWKGTGHPSFPIHQPCVDAGETAPATTSMGSTSESQIWWMRRVTAGDDNPGSNAEGYSRGE